jgi:hypothetical protein
MPIPFFLAMFVLPAAIIGTAILLAGLNRRADRRSDEKAR